VKNPADAEDVAHESFLITTGTVKVRLHSAHHNAKAVRFTIGERKSREEVVAMILECKHVWDYISGYLDDSLSPETKESVQLHLEHCEICSAILDSTRNIIILTADDRIFELPVGFSERLHARLAQEMNGNSRKPDQD
jgi:Putative zinc-finger